ncbi:hypothetical protein [Corynebacterium vitaeruminis]|uniref:Uncharacterized protein n=1 Tax=Corynebacterium vitaeruminis DSM 20294 TaxID=1224164 RepID=W5XX08_9CORY|nr:hypothetical protein [Corynebacterium vitaeruminis]AHI21546.1 hypothetical protein B843_00750 [Corynebacterium vitaeruminis DSM 20294]
MTTPDTNFNTLSNTVSGRLAQAGVGAAITALPDYVSSRALRALIDACLASGLVYAMVESNAQDDDPRNDPAAILEDIEGALGDSTFDLGGPVKTWSVIGAGALVMAALNYLSSKSQEKLAGFLYKRGLKKPNTVLGLLAGLLIFFGTEQAKG